MKAYYPYAKTVYQGEKWMTIQFMLNWFETFRLVPSSEVKSE